MLLTPFRNCEIYGLILFCALTEVSYSSAAVTVDQILKTGTERNRINLVFLSEGYTPLQVPFLLDC